MIIKKHSKKQNKETNSKIIEKPKEKTNIDDDSLDLFDIDNIDFSQRSERRKGDRRRGYRRIDDRNLISRAHEESERIKESSAKEGYRAGLDQAKEDLQKFRESIKNFSGSKDEVFEFIAPDILEISVDIARKIIKKEIEQDPQMILETITDVLKGISKEEKRVNLKVNPMQVESIKENIPEILSANGLDIKVIVSPDDTIEEGGCIFYTHNGVVDASINTQLEIIKEALKGL